MVHTTEKTSSTTPSSASSQQAAEPSLQRAKGQQHLDPAAVQGSAQIGTDVPPGTTESITRSEAGSLHPGGDASRAGGKQAETEAAAADASSAHPKTSANPDEEIKAGTLKACATLQPGIALIQRFGEDAALGPRTRERVTQSFQKAIDGIDQKGDLSLADQTQRRLLEIGVALYSVTANLLDPEVSGSYERKEKCILDSTSALAAPVKEWETNTHLTPPVINGLLGAVLEFYPMVGEVVSAWMQKSGKDIDGLAASKKGSGAQAGNVFTAGDSKYRALADETKSLMKLTHLFLHFSTSVGEFYPRLMSPSTQTNINAMEVLTRQTEKLLHLKGVPAANTLVKDSFAVLTEGAKLFSKEPNARPLYRSLQRTMEFWGVLGKWIDQKLASAKSQASRLHPDMIALFNGYGNELAIELQQLASEMESQKFPGVEDSARLNMVTALRHASESLDILSSALEVTKKIDTHVAPAPNQTLTQQLKTAYDKQPDAEIAAHLGEVLWVAGQKDEARKVWEQGRKKDAKNKTLLETIDRLSS